MDLLSYSLFLIASFLGLLTGMILSNMAVEEITKASRYLKYLNIIIVPTVIIIAAYSINSMFAIISSAIILVLLIIFRDRYDYLWVYACMGALIYLSTLGKYPFETAIMIFIYGLSIATIESSRHFKEKINGKIRLSENKVLIKKLSSRYAYYLLIGMIFYVVFTYFI